MIEKFSKKVSKRAILTIKWYFERSIMGFLTLFSMSYGSYAKLKV